MIFDGIEPSATFAILTRALRLLGAIGCVVFILEYRPFSLRSHGPAGQHLLTMSWGLLGLFGLPLVFAFVPIPLAVARTIAFLVVGVIVFAVWQRVWLHRQVKKGHYLHRLEDGPSPRPGRGDVAKDAQARLE